MKIDKRTCPRNWRLYHLLDLSLSTSAQQVKWNFRKVNLRKHYNQAYHVLSHPDRKHLYDGAGEEALGFITSGTWGPFVPTLGAIGTTVTYCIVLLIAVALLILFFALLAVRIDSVAYMSWRAIVAPLMGLGCLMVIVTAAAVLLNLCSFDRASREFYEPIDRFSPIGNFLASLAYACIPFVLGNAISSNPSAHVGSYMIYMIMPIVGDVLYYLTSLIWRWPSRIKSQLQTCAKNPSPSIYWAIFIIGILTMLCCIAQWVVLGLKLDGHIHSSWYVVFVPFCVRAGLRIIEARVRSYQRWLIGVRSYLHFVFDVLAAIFVNGLFLTSLYLVAVYIENHGRDITFAQALIPVYVILGYIFLGLFFTLFYMLVQLYKYIEEEYRCKAMWRPPIEQADTNQIMYSNPNIRLIENQQLSIHRADDGYDKYDDAIQEGRQMLTSFNDVRDNACGMTLVDKDLRSTTQSNGEDKNDKMTGWGTDEIITPTSTAFDSNSHKTSDPAIISNAINDHEMSNGTHNTITINDNNNNSSSVGSNNTGNIYSVVQVDDGDTVGSRANVMDRARLSNNGNHSVKPGAFDEFEDYTDNDVTVYPDPANGVLQMVEQPSPLPGTRASTARVNDVYDSNTNNSRAGASVGAGRSRDVGGVGRLTQEEEVAANAGAQGYAVSAASPTALYSQPEPDPKEGYGMAPSSAAAAAVGSTRRAVQRHRDPALYCTDPQVGEDSAQMYTSERSRREVRSGSDYDDDKSDYTESYTYEDAEEDENDDYEDTYSMEDGDPSGSYTNSYTYNSTYTDEGSLQTRSDVPSTERRMSPSRSSSPHLRNLSYR